MGLHELISDSLIAQGVSPDGDAYHQSDYCDSCDALIVGTEPEQADGDGWVIRCPECGHVHPLED